MDITVEGLSARQRVLADIIWAFQSRDGVEAFIRSLPQRDQHEAQIVLEMIIASWLDTVDHVSDDTVALLDKYRN